MPRPAPNHPRKPQHDVTQPLIVVGTGRFRLWGRECEEWDAEALAHLIVHLAQERVAERRLEAEPRDKAA
jgi:hypothetical protein